MIGQCHFWVLPEENKNTSLKIYMHSCVYYSIVYNWQDMKAINRCLSIDEWIKKMWYIYIYIHTHIYTIECYSAIKKEWNLAICDNMGGAEGVMKQVRRTKTNTVWFHFNVESKKQNN